MKIEPLTKYRPRPVAVLFPSHRALMVQNGDGQRLAYGKRDVEAMLATLVDYVLYTPDSLEAMIHTTGALSWSCELWKGKPVRAIHNATGARISSLRGIVPHADAYESLEVLLRWLRGYGVSPASIPSMAWQLFRASLDRPYQIGFDPAVGKAAFYGGRQEITTPGIYKDMKLVDISQAYPAAMARPQGYALSLREVDATTTIDPMLAGIATARVFVPESLPYAPLPIRVDDSIISFQHGYIEGTWPWCELSAAQALGCEVDVVASYAPQRSAELFGPWWPLAQEGRTLPGGAGQLGKAISNSTWGQFGMKAEGRGVRRWADDRGTMPVNVELNDHEMPHSWTAHVAAETTARVRTQMLTEGLYGGMTPAHIDTDGVIVPTGSPLPGDNHDGPGTWRVKADITTLDLRAPQLYRYTCPGCGVSHEHWHYNASGIPEADAPGYFTAERVNIDINHEMRFD